MERSADNQHCIQECHTQPSPTCAATLEEFFRGSDRLIQLAAYNVSAATKAIAL